LEKNRAALPAQVQDELRSEGIDLVLGEHTGKDFARAELIVVSPGIPVSGLQRLLPLRARVVSELEFASWFAREPIIAVTGTNGKTTTVKLIKHIFDQAGKDAFLGGNVGTPLAEYVLADHQAEVLVLEVSSFQLQNTVFFHPHVAVLLNFSANHLDYHQDMREYLLAKLMIFANQTPQDLAILPGELLDLARAEVKLVSRVLELRPTQVYTCDGLFGGHNQINMEAAVQCAQAFGVQRAEAVQAVKSFPAQPHRLEKVTEKNGVLVVNDSKATTLDALRAALESFDRPVLLLAGGVFKGGDPAELRELVESRVRILGLFGQSREVFTKAWGDRVETFWEPGLEEAVKHMWDLARSGDVLLLSPATASFDLFDNYQQRGNCFTRAVEALD
jgi:UDP-N-acetylmuramoylalanine--D-glutamate ligase